MLFGPGGVVAVLLGAWGAWWLATRPPGLGVLGRWPAVVAAGVAVLAFVEWSWLAEPASRMADALRHRGDARADLALRAVAPFWAGFRALAVGWGLLGAGAVLAHRSRDGNDAGGGSGGDRASQVLAVAAAAAAGLSGLVILVMSPQLLDPDPRTWVAGRDTVAVASLLGLAPAWLALALCGVTAARAATLRGPSRS